MNEHAINSTPAPSANGANGHVSTTSLAVSLSSAPKVISAVADSLPAKVSPPTPSCSNGIDVLPSKTCATTKAVD